MATALSAFLPYVLPHAPGCTDPMAEQVIRSACIEFCNDTLLVQELVTTSMLANVQDYDVDVPSNMTMVRLLGVMVRDRWLEGASLETVRSALALRGNVGGAVVVTGEPTAFFQKTPSEAGFSVYPIPADTVADAFTIRAAYAPTRTATTVPDVLFNDWVEEITAGAVSRLLRMASQPFYAVGAADAFRSEFDVALRRAGIQARTGLVAAASQVQAVRFF